MTGIELSCAPTSLSRLCGDRVILRLPVAADVEARLEVPPNSELHRMYGGSGEPKTLTREEVEAGQAAITRQDLAVGRQFFIAARVWPDGRPVADSDGRYIGGIRLHGISWLDRSARLAMGIFDRRFWSHGYGTEALRLILRYAFDECDLHRVDLRVLEYNTRAIRCYEKCGFRREGLLRESALVDGVWYNDVIMAILESEYRAQP